jgi:hypothetical protein
VVARLAFVRGSGFDPDATIVVKHAEIRLAAFTLPLDGGKQGMACLEQRAAEIQASWRPSAMGTTAGKDIQTGHPPIVGAKCLALSRLAL